MDDPVDALAAQQEELLSIVGDLDEADLLRPSRCDGWTVADVLLHLAQTNEMATASAQGRLREYFEATASGVPSGGSIDDMAGALVDAERGTPTASRDRYQHSADAQVAAFRAVDPAERVQWVAGDMAARTLATTRLTETWIHTVDVAVAFGPEPEPTDRLWHTSRLVWRTVPYAVGQAGREIRGPVAFELDAPDGAVWAFGMDAEPTTVIRGAALDVCTVAGQRAVAGQTGLTGTGPDADVVLTVMRTFA